MGKLTKGLIIGSSILGGAGLIYEILGDTVIDKAPTLFKLIRGKSSKHEKQDDGHYEYSKEYLKFLSEENENLSNLEKPKPKSDQEKEEERNFEKIFDFLFNKIEEIAKNNKGIINKIDIYSSSKEANEELKKMLDLVPEDYFINGMHKKDFKFYSSGITLSQRFHLRFKNFHKEF